MQPFFIPENYTFNYVFSNFAFMKKKYSAVNNFLLHIHPETINEQALKYNRTFGLGGMTALLFVILVFTGILLRFFYIPTPENAYNSILNYQENSIYGSFLRNLHHWSAKLMIITGFLHLIRVFYSQSYYSERRKTWYYGLLLFILILSSNFTGYLLPWDQLSYWAVSIMTGIIEYIPFIGKGTANLLRGGESVNGNTLLNFYNFHTAILPLFFIIFSTIHFWLIRKAKGVTVSNKENKKTVPVNPDLIYREIIVALILIIFLFLISFIFDAPLSERANPAISPNPSKAPWYFIGLQELLINLHPLIVSLLIPAALFLFLYYLPRIKIPENKTGKWFYSEKGKKITIISAVVSFVITFLLILFLEYTSHLNKLHLPLFVETGLIPLVLYLIPFSIFILVVRKRYKAGIIETIISIFTIIASSYITMTLTGLFLREKGMHLIF